MNRVERRWLCLLTAVVFVVGICTLWRERDERPGPDGGGLTPWPMNEEQQEQQAEIDRVRERIAAKHAVVVAFLAERLTLRQAAARFQELDATTQEGQLALWRAHCPGDTDEERYCWTVLRYVAPIVQDNPQLSRAVRQRVAAELPDHLCRLVPQAFDFTEF